MRTLVYAHSLTNTHAQIHAQTPACTHVDRKMEMKDSLKFPLQEMKCLSSMCAKCTHVLEEEEECRDSISCAMQFIPLMVQETLLDDCHGVCGGGGREGGSCKDL